MATAQNRGPISPSGWPNEALSHGTLVGTGHPKRVEPRPPLVDKSMVAAAVHEDGTSAALSVLGYPPGYDSLVWCRQWSKRGVQWQSGKLFHMANHFTRPRDRWRRVHDKPAITSGAAQTARIDSEAFCGLLAHPSGTQPLCDVQNQRKITLRH